MGMADGKLLIGFIGYPQFARRTPPEERRRIVSNEAGLVVSSMLVETIRQPRFQRAFDILNPTEATRLPATARTVSSIPPMLTRSPTTGRRPSRLTSSSPML